MGSVSQAESGTNALGDAAGLYNNIRRIGQLAVGLNGNGQKSLAFTGLNLLDLENSVVYNLLPAFDGKLRKVEALHRAYRIPGTQSKQTTAAGDFTDAHLCVGIGGNTRWKWRFNIGRIGAELGYASLSGAW